MHRLSVKMKEKKLPNAVSAKTIGAEAIMLKITPAVNVL